jgi:hypothetical protein
MFMIVKFGMLNMPLFYILLVTIDFVTRHFNLLIHIMFASL